MEETKEAAKKLIEKISLEDRNNAEKALIIGLSGELGSGKTTFMKFFAEALGVEETIQSPTFVIMKKFNINFKNFSHLIHIDAYRLESGEELLKLGWQELITDPKNLICIEWPERVEEICKPDFMLRFEHYEGSQEGREDQRKISLT